MRCLVVTLSQEGLKALSAPRQTTRKVLDNIGVVKGKTAEKQDKFTLPIFCDYILGRAFGSFLPRCDRLLTMV